MMDVTAAGSNEMDLLDSAAAGMSAQRSMLDIAARNVAAAQASQPGHPYARLVAEYAPPAAPDDDALSGHNEFSGDSGPVGAELPAVSVHAEPGSGDSLSEMIAVLDAQRAYEQNASVFDIAKRLAERTIDIGRS